MTWASEVIMATLVPGRSEEHTSELQYQIISYAVFCLKKKKTRHHSSVRSSRTPSYARKNRRHGSLTVTARSPSPTPTPAPPLRSSDHHTAHTANRYSTTTHHRCAGGPCRAAQTPLLL